MSAANSCLIVHFTLTVTCLHVLQTRPASAQVLTVHNSPRRLSRPYTPLAQPQPACQIAAAPAIQLDVLSAHAGLDTLAQVCTAADT